MSAATTWAIVPVKALDRAKQRLAPALQADARRRLMLLMLEDALAVLLGVMEHVLVVTSDETVIAKAEPKGAAILREPRMDNLNAAVRRGLLHAAAKGATAALVLPADVPFATRDELAALLETTTDPGRSRVVIVPDRKGNGTNALLLAPPEAMQPAFGAGSFVEHLSQAVARRLDVRVLHLSGLATDIDEPQDLMHLFDDPRTAARYGTLRGSLIDSGAGKPNFPGVEER